MCPVPYYDLMRQSKDPRYVRLYMVRLAQQEGIKPVARIFGTTPKTVRKWLRRYQQQGYAGLRDQSRAPKQAAGAITPAQKRQAISAQKGTPFGEPASNATMGHFAEAHGGSKDCLKRAH